MPPLPHIRHKVIQHTRPSPILTPPTHRLILQALLGKSTRLIPHILAHTLLPARRQKLDPKRQPIRILRHPGDTARTEQEPPVVERRIKRHVFLTGSASDDESVFVDTREVFLVGGKQGAHVGDRSLLLGEGFGVEGLPAGDEAVAGEFADGGSGEFGVDGEHGGFVELDAETLEVFDGAGCADCVGVGGVICVCEYMSNVIWRRRWKAYLDICRRAC